MRSGPTMAANDFIARLLVTAPANKLSVEQRQPPSQAVEWGELANIGFAKCRHKRHLLGATS
jgi:hypothetical protein